MIEHKIILTGTMGAGKSTAIAAVSDTKPVETDVINNDKSVEKNTTTVAFDYGEVLLGPNERLRLYGTPGQTRFDFMWRILAQGALGVIILIDHSAPKPTKALSSYIDGFYEHIKNSACVIGVSKTDLVTGPDAARMDDYIRIVNEKGIVCPVVKVDARERSQVLNLFNLLLTQLES